jgi:hypothetical protein
MVNGFDFFDGLQHPNIVICDIDAGYTNNIAQFNGSLDLPMIPDEAMYIRILNVTFYPILTLLDVEKLENKLV